MSVLEEPVAAVADLLAAGNPAQLTVLDLACGMPLGRSGRPVDATPATPASVRERVFGPSLREGRCCMPFSGGLESAIWLAAATDHARRHGDPDPIPLTLRHPGLASAAHLRAQERIVAHLGLTDWERVNAEDGLDLVGPLAGSVLSATGPLWPPTAFMMAPLIAAARGGTFLLVTGISDFFAWWHWATLYALARDRRRPSRHELALLGCALAPVGLRARALAGGRMAPALQWLTPVARHEALTRLMRRAAEVPLRYDRAIATQATHRCFAASAASIAAIGTHLGTRVDQPLSRPGTVEMLAGAAGRRGDDTPWSALSRLCGDVLPASLLSSGRGPDLTRVFFAAASREFAAGWNGGGVDEAVVDAEALRRVWLSDRPDPRTACLLQCAWLAHQPASQRSLVSTTP